MPEMARPSTVAETGSDCDAPLKASHSASPDAAMAIAAAASASGVELTISAQARSVSMPT